VDDYTKDTDLLMLRTLSIKAYRYTGSSVPNLLNNLWFEVLEHIIDLSSHCARRRRQGVYGLYISDFEQPFQAY